MSSKETFNQISPSEFFYRNRDLAGFSNPTRSLYTAVREFVENSLDACDGKGILAADESTNTIKKRFNSINVESNEETRCFYRDTLFSTPDISKYISGVILFEETFFQKNSSNESLKEKLENINCYPGIKIDQGLYNLY